MFLFFPTCISSRDSNHLVRRDKLQFKKDFLFWREKPAFPWRDENHFSVWQERMDARYSVTLSFIKLSSFLLHQPQGPPGGLHSNESIEIYNF
ncbi:hypothetical protein CDAR_576991 [Caerostris darwini]|uniref:Ycf15 n=1 Tax=Caerostris darwini TaxID=1538125 RepID=A0AAV4W7G6_9ARAC|nr:hypothetical protein CDAR_576991 [Caerostris darwini]